MIDLSNLGKQVYEDKLEISPPSIGNSIGTVVYTITSNYAWYVLPSIVSLLRNNYVDKLYIISDSTEGDYSLPDEIIVYDCSNQPGFTENCKSIDYGASSTVLLRIALSKILKEDRCLSIDADTIITGSLYNLGNKDLDNNYFGAVREYNTTRFVTNNYINYNCGVLLMDLKKMRDDHVDDALINFINNYKLGCGEQDAINILYYDRIKELSIQYNVNQYTQSYNTLFVNPVIVHFAGNDSRGYKDDYKFTQKIYLDYYKMYIERYSNLRLKDCKPVLEVDK